MLAGKSTTIFHIISARVSASASCLLTAERNAALQALLTKLAKNAKFRHELLVFGRDERLGGATAPYQLERLIQNSNEKCDVGGGDDSWTWLNLAFLLQRGLEATKATFFGDIAQVPLHYTATCDLSSCICC